MRFFGLSNGYWLRAQAAYDTEVAEEVLAKERARPSRGRHSGVAFSPG
jgi:plasmid maintenance system antidote protein VapI